jgi:hypothetical protein
MNFLAFLFLLAAVDSRVQLVDESYNIPADDWRYIEVELKQLPVTVQGAFDVEKGAGPVRMALLRHVDLDRLRKNQAHGALALSEPGARGRLDAQVRQPGDYVILVDNRGANSKPVRVHLGIWLDFANRGFPGITYVPPGRKLAVYLLSFLFFFAIVTWSARRLAPPLLARFRERR